MLVREVKFEDLDQVDSFLIKNQEDSIDIQTLKKIFLKNPHTEKFKEIPLGWLIEVDNDIVGFVGNIPKLYKKKDKYFFVSIFTTWVVNKNYRFSSMLLLTKYLKQSNIDLFINTTANVEAYKAWKAIGAEEIPLKSVGEVEFHIINTENFLKSFFNKKKIRLNIVFIKLFSIIFKIIFYFKINFHKIYQNKYEYIITHKIDDELNNFIKTNNVNNKYFGELISKETLSWNIDCRTKNNKYWITKIYDQKKLAGFSICFGNINKVNGHKKCFLGFVLLNENNDESYFSSLIKLCISESKNNNYDSIEFKNFNKKYKNYLKKFFFFKREYKNKPYLYKLGKNYKDSIDFTDESNWNVSLLDGDILVE
jgi:hypothetical protein